MLTDANIDTIGTIVSIIVYTLLIGASVAVICRLIYEAVKKKKYKNYKSSSVSDLLKITDPTTGVPKSMVGKTEADEYLREARNIEARKAITKDIDDF